MRELVLTEEEIAAREYEQMLRGVAAMKAEIAQTAERAEQVLQRLRAKLVASGGAVLRLVGAKP